MPTTKKQEKARKSREAEMLSDIENLDIMLGGNHFDRNVRNESVNSNQACRPESLFGDEFGDENENEFPNREIMDQVQIPKWAIIQSESVQVLRSIDCRVS